MSIFIQCRGNEAAPLDFHRPTLAMKWETLSVPASKIIREVLS